MPHYKVVKENDTKKLKDYSKPSAQMPSYIGMLDISTTNSTLAKVKAIYGADTSWIQHSGYVLRGATSGVTSNDATKTGGNDNAVAVTHTHTIRTEFGASVNPSFTPESKSYAQVAGGNSATQVWRSDISSSGEDGTNKNIPNYKSVYIWERTA